MEVAVGVEPVDRLRRDVAARGLGVERLGVGDEVGERRHEIEQPARCTALITASLCFRKRHQMSWRCVATATRVSASVTQRFGR